MSEQKDVNRRDYLKYAAGAVAGAVVAGIAGYYGGAASAPTGPGAATTVTQTATKTETATITSVPSPEPKWRIVWSWGCAWFTGYIPSMIGASTICKMLNMALSWEGTNDCVDAKYADFIQSKVASLDPEKDMLVIHMYDLIEGICKKALEKGIGVFGSNTDDLSRPENQRNRLSVVVQDAYEGGKLNANYLLDQGYVKKGDLVCSGGSERGFTALEERMRGVRETLQTAGVKVDEIAYTYDPAQVPARWEAYYRGHPDVKAFCASDGAGGVGMEAFMKNAGLQPGQIAAVVWDVTPEVIKGIHDGYVTGANDQQFYFQGFYPPVIAWLWKNPFTGFMRPVSIRVAGTIVDKNNIDTFEKFVKACEDQIRELGWFKF